MEEKNMVPKRPASIKFSVKPSQPDILMMISGNPAEDSSFKLQLMNIQTI